VADLGSVFEADDDRPKGPDLRVTVEVPRAALGASLLAPVPMRLAANGELIERVVVDGDQPGLLTLHLPEVLPNNAVLRLRGQGGRNAEGQRAGDLFVVIELVDRPPRGDERILRSSVALRDAGSVAPRDGTDITWWLLGGLALLCAAVLAVVFSL
jgi:hypothetical protein